MTSLMSQPKTPWSINIMGEGHGEEEVGIGRRFGMGRRRFVIGTKGAV